MRNLALFMVLLGVSMPIASQAVEVCDPLVIDETGTDGIWGEHEVYNPYLKRWVQSTSTPYVLAWYDLGLADWVPEYCRGYIDHASDEFEIWGNDYDNVIEAASSCFTYDPPFHRVCPPQTGPLGHIWIFGGAGDDELIGSVLTEYMYGEDGCDILDAKEALDALVDHDACDILIGNDGYDLCVDCSVCTCYDCEYP